MITISIRVKDCTDKWRYHKFKSNVDRQITFSDIEPLWTKIIGYLRVGEIPELKYEVKFNSYVGCVAGMSGVWTRMIDEVRANRIMEHTVSQINTAIANNQKQLGISKVV